jgi:integrase
MARSTAYIEISRHSVYYFRIRVPLAARTAIAATHIRKSLKTKCRREAVVRCAALLEQVERIFAAAERGEIVDLPSLTWRARYKQTIERAQLDATVEVEPCRKLSLVWTQYEKEQRLEGVSAKTIMDKQSLVKLLIRVIGDKPVRSIDRKEAQRFKEVALKLPPRINQLPRQSISQLIEKAKQTISITTFNNWVKNLVTIFKFAQREGYCDNNPFEGLKVKQRVKASEQRSRLSDNDLRQLFDLGSYPDKTQKLSYRYWLPYLGLYTGARLNELCQLYLDDFVVVDGIDCIHIRGTRPDQKLKNLTSERVVPINSKLKELGLLQYVERLREEGCARLFPELRWSKFHGYGVAPSIWFNRYMDARGLKSGSERKDFHSFRHTVADSLKQQGVSEELVGGLLGHTTGGITFGRYGKDWNPVKLASLVELLLIP